MNPTSGWWFRYVDDTHTKQKIEFVEGFTQHFNQFDPDIKFIIEKEQDSTMAFLNTSTIRKQDGSIYRKATHTDQYLYLNSAHPTDKKIGVERTLHQRAEVVISEDTDFKSEIDQVNSALKRCNYPGWAIKKVAQRLSESKEQKEKRLK